MKKNSRRQKRIRRHLKVRSKISGTSEIPRLCVFRSNKHILCQLINDSKSETILSASDLEVKKGDSKDFSGKEKKAYLTGMLIAKKAAEKDIKKVVFDRGGYAFHGRVKALAEGAKKGGLKF